MSRPYATVLITGSGGSIAVNLTRSLKMAPRKIRLIGCDANPYFMHLSETDSVKLIPSAKDKDGYLASIKSLCDREEVDLILPSNLLEVLLLAECRNEFKAKLFLPQLQSIEDGADKWRTYETLRDAGVPVPETELVERKTNIEALFSSWGSSIWLRGRGIPGLGIGVASLPAKSSDQARSWIDFHDAWSNMTAAELLPGDNLTWMGLWREGKLIASQGRKRISYVISHVSPSGVTGAPSVSHTVHDQRLNEFGPRAMLAMDANYTGVGFVDFKCDAQGNPKVTEVNVGRFGTTHHFYTEAGANFPFWYVQAAFGEKPVDAKPFNCVKEDLYWIRSLDTSQKLVKKEDLRLGDEGTLLTLEMP